MKILDEKGKLFGLINVIDLAAILCIILVAVALVYKLAAPAASDVITPKVDMYVTMRVRGAMDYLEAEVRKVTPGTRLIAGNDYIPDAEVISVESVPYLTSVSIPNGGTLTTTDPNKSDILIKVRSKQNKNAPILKIGTQEVRIGRGFTFKTQSVEINAIVETVEFDA